MELSDDASCRPNRGSENGPIFQLNNWIEQPRPSSDDAREVNETLTDDPAVLNSDPFGAGGLVRIRATDTAALEGLMDQATYDEKHPVG